MTSTFARRAQSWTDGLSVALVPWLVARVLVFGALGVAREVADSIGVAPRPVQLDQGLLAWDAAFYADIAESGYASVGDAGLRFFPLAPLLARAVAVVPGVDSDLALLVVANVAALAFGVMLHRLVLIETGDRDWARRAVWVGYLAPLAFTQVMGYAESLLMALAVGVFLALRGSRWWLVALFGFLAGLARPPGVLLAVPVLVVVWRERRRWWTRDWFPRVVALAAPAAGLLTYLLWVRERTGDLWFALDAHTASDLRGPTVEPVGNLAETLGDLLDGRGSGLAFLAAALLLALAVRAWFVLPPEYALYAGAALVVALTADNLDPLARIGLSTFPLAIAAASLIGRPIIERSVLIASGGALVGASVLAFTGALVP